AAIAGAFEDAALQPRALAEVERADGVADRLRREASRVGRFAAVRAEQAMHRRSREAAAQRADAASRAASAARDAASGRFAAMGVRPLDPAAMLDWLRRRAAIVADLAEAAAENANVAAFEESERDARVHLARALGAPLDASLERLVERVDEVVTTAATKLRERERAREALAAGEAAEATTSEAEAVAQLARAGLDASLDEDAVRGEIDDRRRARAARAALARVDAELELAAEAERRLETIVASVERALGGSATEGDVALRAERVSLELRRARERTEASRALDAERAEIVKRRDDALALRARAVSTLEAHVVRAGVANVAALEEAERRSSRARELGSRIAEIEAALRAAGDGAAPGELEAEVEHLDEETLLSEQGELEDRRDDVTKRRDEAFHREVTWKMGLERFEESNAAEHAARAEVSRARAHALAARWIRLRLASVVLEREMEAYRRAFQDPLLGRASELFAKLTSGSFERLAVRVSDKDRPELVCVRAGREIDVEGLSDGTRDQLYLALRLATIERHARHADPLPLVLDDVLVHFDDERSALALELFADVAETVQVILFTHHERIASLARERLGGRAHVLRLAR
ncbi:MAG TPA: hypothetical protein VL400_00050, partial [Polyangiaceae bacterium]|nr:hypothetical protein [Polyangiaceae bacterium]